MPHTVQFDPTDRCPHIAIKILQTVADLTNTSMDDLPRVDNAICTTSLEHIHSQDSTADRITTIFDYHDYLITVDSGGTITFQERH